MQKKKHLTVSIALALGIIGFTAPSMAVTNYVRHGGAGTMNGTSWADAYSSIQAALNALPWNSASDIHVVNVEASTNAQAYDTASRDLGGGADKYLFVRLEGGWTNVAVLPGQGGLSAIRDLTGPVDATGLHIFSDGATHGKGIRAIVNRFTISDVMNGIVLLIPSNVGGPEAQLFMNNVSVTARQTGISVSYKSSETRILATNCTILAGQGGVSGNGAYIYGTGDGSVFDNCRITSAAGYGLLHNETPRVNVNYFGVGAVIKVRDSRISGCYRDGYRRSEVNLDVPYASGPTLLMDRSHFIGNGWGTGSGGIRMEFDQKDIDAPLLAMVLIATNSVIASNAQYGVHFNGMLETPRGAAFSARLVNSTLAENGGNGIQGISPESSGSSVTLYNSIVAGNASNGVYVADQSLIGPSIVEAHNDFFGNAVAHLARVGTGGTTNPAPASTDLTVDPLFCKAFDKSGLHPYRPFTGSPILESASAAYAPALDILLEARPIRGGYAMGAYESPLPPPRGTIVLFR